MKSYSRRTHRKTRTGCIPCKRRKIKCGEQKPACENCIKHSIECEYAYQYQSTPRLAGAASAGSQQAAPGYSTSPLNNNSPGGSETALSARKDPSLGVQYPALDPNLGSLNLIDLELLHNFSTSTFSSLSPDPTLKTLWRINVPQLGLAHGFVMRGILAFSALHLAHHCIADPARRAHYVDLALFQHQQGLRKATALLPHVNTENCSALYIFTALSSLFSIARTHVRFEMRDADGEETDSQLDFPTFGATNIPEWLILFRGTRSVVDSSQAALQAGVLGPMFVAGERRAMLRGAYVALPRSHEEEKLEELRECINRTAPTAVAPNSLAFTSDLDVYNATIDELQRCFMVIYRPAPLVAATESADVFIWLFRITDEYLALMRQRTQPSLAILAFFCVLAQRLEGNWWMQGWSGLLMGRIWATLDEEHRLWVQWPVEEMGWLR